jgi:integrase
MWTSHSLDAPMRIEDALASFVLQLEADGRSRHTIEQYRRHVRLFASWLAPEDDLRRVDYTAIARFFASPCARIRADGTPRKSTTVNAMRTSIRCWFAFLAASGALERDPLATGLRVGSLVALQVDDVIGGEILVRRAKGDVAVRVFVPRALRPEFDRYVAGRSGPLFPGPGGRPLTTRHVARRLRRWCERARIEPCSPHALRRTMGTRLYAACRDPLVVQRGLGHRSLVSVLPYIGGVEERLREVVGA